MNNNEQKNKLQRTQRYFYNLVRNHYLKYAQFPTSEEVREMFIEATKNQSTFFHVYRRSIEKIH